MAGDATRLVLYSVWVRGDDKVVESGKYQSIVQKHLYSTQYGVGWRRTLETIKEDLLKFGMGTDSTKARLWIYGNVQTVDLIGSLYPSTWQEYQFIDIKRANNTRSAQQLTKFAKGCVVTCELTQTTICKFAVLKVGTIKPKSQSNRMVVLVKILDLPVSTWLGFLPIAKNSVFKLTKQKADTKLNQLDKQTVENFLQNDGKIISRLKTVKTIIDRIRKKLKNETITSKPKPKQEKKKGQVSPAVSSLQLEIVALKKQIEAAEKEAKLIQPVTTEQQSQAAKLSQEFTALRTQMTEQTWQVQHTRKRDVEELNARLKLVLDQRDNLDNKTNDAANDLARVQKELHEEIVAKTAAETQLTEQSAYEDKLNKQHRKYEKNLARANKESMAFMKMQIERQQQENGMRMMLQHFGPSGSGSTVSGNVDGGSAGSGAGICKQKFKHACMQQTSILLLSIYINCHNNEMFITLIIKILIYVYIYIYIYIIQVRHQVLLHNR